MPALWLVVIALVLAAIGFVLGRSRALTSGGGDIRALHSRPGYYGWNVALSSLVPAVGVLLIWMLVQSFVVNSTVAADVPERAVPEDQTLSLVMGDVGRVAAGLDLAVRRGVISETDARDLEINGSNIRDLLAQVGKPLASDVTEPILTAAQEYRALTSTGNTLRGIAVLGVAQLGFGFAFSRTNSTFRARNAVESRHQDTAYPRGLPGRSDHAGHCLVPCVQHDRILQDLPRLGIFPVADMGAQFWRRVRAWHRAALMGNVLYLDHCTDRGGAHRPILGPSTFRNTRRRGGARSPKPLIEVLAGIPTIVYGLFALLTVGPLLVSIFGDDGVGIMQAGTAVMTAGLVMGVMLIPLSARSATTSSTPCRRRCATALMVWARRNQKPSSR